VHPRETPASSADGRRASKNGEASGEKGGNDGGGDDEDGDDDIGVEEGAGLVTTESDDDFDATVERITSAIEGNDALTLVTTVDHAANAESVDMELPPTTVLIFGNPELGTPLMQASRSVAIDLPQKLLVREEDGDVFVTYNHPRYLAARHGIDDEDDVLETIAGALETLATGSSG
jgi:uncharacterized protein (DUF302 family)